MTNRRLSKLYVGIISTLLGLSEPTAAVVSDRQYEALIQRIRVLEQKVSSRQAPLEKSEQQPDGELKQRVQSLEKQLETTHQEWVEKERIRPKIVAGEEGFAIQSSDGDFQLKLRGYIQADSRFFTDDSRASDEFVLRRVRLNLDGRLFKYVDFRLAPDFGGSDPRIFDAFLDLHYFPEASLTAGKFKPPLSLERLQSATALLFAERSFPDQLTPRREIGLMLHGHFAAPGNTLSYSRGPLAKAFFNYHLGVFNGEGDRGGFNEGDSDDNKEIIARLFAHPFRASGIGPLKGLGIGIAGSYANPSNLSINNLRTPGQATLLRYDDDVTSVGTHYRIYPQAYWYWGPFGAMAEWVLSSQRLKNAVGNEDRQQNRAWQLALSYVLTGEEASYGRVKPSHYFDPFNGEWGAFQLAARYSELHIDDDTFPAFADVSRSASKAQSWALGINWYLNNNVKIMADYEQTNFDDGAPTGDRQKERVFISRFQIAF